METLRLKSEKTEALAAAEQHAAEAEHTREQMEQQVTITCLYAALTAGYSLRCSRVMHSRDF